MQLPFPDVLAALDQLAAATSSETHRQALQAAIDAVHFQNAIEATLERHSLESSRRGGPALPLTRPLEKWSLDEDVQLRLEFESGMTLDVIAAQHVRSPLEVAERLHKPLGLLTEQAVEEIRVARSRQRAKFEYESAAGGDDGFDPEFEEGGYGAIDMGDEQLECVEDAAPAAIPAAPVIAPAPVAVSVAPAVTAPVVTAPAAPAVAATPAPAPVAEVMAPAPPAAPAPAPVIEQVPAQPEVPVVAMPVAVAAIVTPVASAPAPASPPAAQVAPAPAAVAPAVPEQVAAVPTAPPAAEPVAVAAAPVPSPAPAPAPAAPAASSAVGAKPALTSDEETTVAQIMAKYNSKNAPKIAVRDYVKSDRFTVKVRPEVQAWLLAELVRLG